MYKHIVLVFDKPIGSISNATITAIINKKVAYNSPVMQFKLAPKEVFIPDVAPIQGYAANRQVCLLFDEPLNNAVGNISIEYKSGIYGVYNEAVNPFIKEFTPSEMELINEPSVYENIYVSMPTSGSTRNSLIVNSAAPSIINDYAVLGTLIKDERGTTTKQYVGSIVP